jgi:hypothetical protein
MRGADGAVQNVLLDTGLRADDKSAYPDWVRTINERMAA